MNIHTNCFFPSILYRRAAVALLLLGSGFSAMAEQTWVNVTNDLGGGAAWKRGSNSTIAVAPGTDAIYTNIGSVGIFSSTDGGAHWTNTSNNPAAVPVNGIVNNFVFDPKNQKTFWIACMYGRGLFKTTDGGKSFIQLGTLSHLDGITVDFTDPERKTLVFAQHEKARSLMISKDGGATWADIGKNIPENTRFTTWPLLVNSKVIITNTSGWGGGKITGIFRSEDAGETWTKVSELSPGGFPLLTSKGDIFYPAWSGLAHSADAGKTWTLVKAPVENSIIELPDGRLAGAGKGFLQISNDNGATWTAYGPPIPDVPIRYAYARYIAYLPGMKAFLLGGHSDKTIPNAIWRLDEGG